MYNFCPLLVQILTKIAYTSFTRKYTMNKLNDMNGYVRLNLDKLPALCAYLVRLDGH